MRKHLSLALAFALVFSLVLGTASVAMASASPVTIRVFTNLPDRKNGQGLVEQTLFDEYMKANPNVTIEVEALHDEEYKTKFKAYAAGTDMPDLISVWGQPGFIAEPIAAGIFAELNPDDYKDYGFLPGSLDGFSADGKLYGLPRNTDVMGFYYNKKLFDDNGWTVPATYQELLDLSAKITAKGILPVAMDGQDKWPLYCFYTDLLSKIHGAGVMDMTSKAIAANDYSDPSYLKGAQILQDSAKAGLFQVGFENTDYGTALNMFTSGQAAMYYMGSWEMSMAANQDVAIRDDIHVFAMPPMDGAAGTVKDIAAWHGGGYAVSANGKATEEAKKLLNYMFLPEGWNKLAWQFGVCMSAQNFAAFKTGKETKLQNEWIDIVNTATSLSGTPTGDMGTAEYKTRSEDLVQQLAIGSVTPQQYLDGLAGK
jgi:raffinose/stachyose/melibiose transport system substrate-binding protein